MDPKSALYNTRMPTTEVVALIRGWLEKDPTYAWDTQPEQVITIIEQEGDTILYGRFCQILDQAKTGKMVGTANKGMSWFKDTLKVRAKRGDFS